VEPDRPDKRKVTPVVRRFLPSIIVIILGAGLILTFLILRSSSERLGDEASLMTPSALSEVPDRTGPSGDVSGTSSEPATKVATATRTPQPIVPTRTPGAPETPLSAEEPATNDEPLVDVTPTGTPVLPTAIPCPLEDCLARSGISGQLPMVTAAQKAGLNFGQYLSWWVEPDPPETGDARFWQLVPLRRDGPALAWGKLEEIVHSQPNSIWIIGNEPDIIWQDNLKAEQYAQIYHELYTFIKEQDPGALVAIAGVGQPTPLRMNYLDQVLGAYQENYGEKMPVDIWTIHAFVLREQQDSWGVGIPPGMDIEHGQLYEVADHDNLDYFSENLVNFRAWMAERGYGEAPLAVTEFGILHPVEYGFPSEKVAEFMIGAFDFFANAKNDTGYAADDHRLVQWWFWYSVFDGADYPTGNLYDPEQGQLTAIGQLFNSLVAGE